MLKHAPPLVHRICSTALAGVLPVSLFACSSSTDDVGSSGPDLKTIEVFDVTYDTWLVLNDEMTLWDWGNERPIEVRTQPPESLQIR